MDFGKRLTALRKARKLSQRELADKIKMHVVQIQRYETGKSQPTLEVIRNLAVVLGVTTDSLIFGKEERDPDEDLRLQFDMVKQFDPEEKRVAKAVLEGLILKHSAKKWGS